MSVVIKYLLIGTIFVSSLSAERSTAYMFTNLDGRTLKADIIAATKSAVTVRRSSDRRTFTLSIDLLIPEDAVFIQRWLSLKQVEKELPANNSIGKWPRKVKPSDYTIEIVREDNATETYIYRTPHFEFHSNVKLARKVVREFSQIFESTFLAVAELPLNFNPDLPKDTRFITQIFETREQYIASGGVPNSGGVYFLKDRKIMLPLPQLGVKKTSSSYTIDETKENSMLIHEITHQVTHDWLSKLPVWASEGIAEYLEHVPYDRGAFRFDQFEVSEALHWNNYRLRGLEMLMTMSKETWSQTLAKDFRKARSNYTSAFILYYYFCHFELNQERRPGLLYNYLRALEAGEHEREAIRILLNERTYKELEEEVKRAYKREDIDIEFD